jgi:hypothetical protein
MVVGKDGEAVKHLCIIQPVWYALKTNLPTDILRQLRYRLEYWMPCSPVGVRRDWIGDKSHPKMNCIGRRTSS